MKTTYVLLAAFSFFLSFPVQGEQCVESSGCDGDLICRTDLNGRGTCISQDSALRELGQNTSGKIGDPCSMPLDCREGLICARPHGYLTYGVCRADVRHERAE